MKPAPFDYVAPATLEEALSVLAEHGSSAKLLAGGQSLIPAMNFRLAQPSLIVDLNRLTILSRIHPDESHGMRIGAMVRQSELEHSPLVKELAPLLHHVMPHVAHPQIRNRGTLGGSLAHADPASELPVIMVALQAGFKLRSSNGERWVNAIDFFEGLFSTALEPEEILLEVALPPKWSTSGYAFLEQARRHGDYAQAGVAAVVTLNTGGQCQSLQLVYLNAGDKPMVAHAAAQMMVGNIPTPELIDEVVNYASQEEIDPVSDIHDSAAFRRHLAYVLGKRALTSAVTDARTGIAQ